MAKLYYSEDDLFNHSFEKSTVIAHVVNNQNAMGSGFVVPLVKRWPIVKAKYHEFADYNGLELGNAQIITVSEDPQIIVANMIAQKLGGLRPLYYNHLVKAMESVALIAKDREIIAPLFGAGLAGGNWEIIEELVMDIWVRQEIDVTVYWKENLLPVGLSSDNLHDRESID